MDQENAKKPNNVVKFHRQIQLNMGLIICILILAYVVFHVFSYLTTETISVYEVKQGSITSDDSYTAMALREEQVFYSDMDGSIYYFVSNNSRVGVRSTLYAIDTTGDIASLLRSNEDTDATDLSDSDVSDIESMISSFTYGYDSNDFKKTYTFKTNLSEQLLGIYNAKNQEIYAEQISQAMANGTYQSYNASVPGLFVLNIDGYEGVTLDSFTSDLLDSSDYTVNNLSTVTEVHSGEPVYKLVTSDNWQLIMAVSSSVKSQLSEESYVELTFDEDNVSAWGAISFLEQAGTNYLVLTLDDSMERYADQRFLKIHLKLNEESGLKIPVSSIVEKTFFTVPKSYFMQGDDSSSMGLILSGEGSTNEFITPTIYYETDDYYYIDSEDVSEGDVIIMPNSTETYTIGTDTENLSGVYNVNKGYAVFKIIEIIYENEDYVIVKSGTDYGISLYDHIVLQGDMVSEDDIIY